MYVRRPDFEVRYSKTGDRKQRHWKICGYPSGKRQVFWFSDKKDAKREAETLNLQLRKYGAEAASLNVHQKLDALRALQLLRGDASLSECASFYLEQKKLRLTSKPLTEIVSECLELNTKRARTDEVSKSQLQNLAKGARRLLLAFGGRNAGDITREDILRWLDSLPVSATSRDYYRRYASTFFAFGVTYGYLKQNPCSGIKSGGSEGDIRILDLAQCRALMYAAPLHMVPFYALALFAGLRPESEIKRIEWSAVDLKDRLIRVGNWKTGRRKRSARFRDVQISDNLARWLEPYREWKGSIWPMSWRGSHDATREAAGITDWPKDCLRHAYGSYLLAYTHNSAFVADQMGHQNAKMIYERYRRLVKPSEAAEFWNIYPQESLKEQSLV
jgi:integrase